MRRRNCPSRQKERSINTARYNRVLRVGGRASDADIDDPRLSERFDLVNSMGKAKFHYAILVADLVADLQRAGIWPYLAR